MQAMHNINNNVLQQYNRIIHMSLYTWCTQQKPLDTFFIFYNFFYRIFMKHLQNIYSAPSHHLAKTQSTCSMHQYQFLHAHNQCLHTHVLFECFHCVAQLQKQYPLQFWQYWKQLYFELFSHLSITFEMCLILFLSSFLCCFLSLFFLLFPSCFFSYPISLLYLAFFF